MVLTHTLVFFFQRELVTRFGSQDCHNNPRSTSRKASGLATLVLLHQMSCSTLSSMSVCRLHIPSTLMPLPTWNLLFIVDVTSGKSRKYFVTMKPSGRTLFKENLG